MRILVDILDDRLEALAARDDRERLRRYLEMWRAGTVDPLRDRGVVVIAELDGGGPGPRCLVVNDGEGYGDKAGGSGAACS